MENYIVTDSSLVCGDFHNGQKNLIGHANICYASEWSEVDPVKKEVSLKTVNLTFCTNIAVVETMKYVPHPSDPSKTNLSQAAMVTVSMVPFKSYMEDLLTSKIAQNASKGLQAMEWVIDKLEGEVKDIASTARKSTDDLFAQTRRQIDDLTMKTRQSMDELQNAARISLDEIHNLAGTPSAHSMPKC